MACCLTKPSRGKVLKSIVKPTQYKYFASQLFGGSPETCYSLDGPTDGPLIIFCHGIECGQWVWEGQGNAYAGLKAFFLNQGYRLLTWDLYGRGGSDLPLAGKYDEEFYAEQLAELLKYLQLWDKPKTLLGHSIGGGLCVAFTGLYPEAHVVRLILLAPAGFIPDNPASNGLKKCFCCVGECFFGLFGNKFLDSLKVAIVNPNKTKQREADALSAAIHANSSNHPGYFTAVSMMIRDFATGNLSKYCQVIVARLGGSLAIKTGAVTNPLPILFLWGDQDGTKGFGCPYKEGTAKYLHEFPHARLETFKGLHHMMFIEDTEQTFGYIQKFLDETKFVLTRTDGQMFQGVVTTQS